MGIRRRNAAIAPHPAHLQHTLLMSAGELWLRDVTTLESVLAHPHLLRMTIPYARAHPPPAILADMTSPRRAAPHHPPRAAAPHLVAALHLPTVIAHLHLPVPPLLPVLPVIPITFGVRSPSRKRCVRMVTSAKPTNGNMAMVIRTREKMDMEMATNHVVPSNITRKSTSTMIMMPLKRANMIGNSDIIIVRNILLPRIALTALGIPSPSATRIRRREITTIMDMDMDRNITRKAITMMVRNIMPREIITTIAEKDIVSMEVDTSTREAITTMVRNIIPRKIITMMKEKDIASTAVEVKKNK